MNIMQANKVVLKLFLADEVSLPQENYIPVFHRVIREKAVSDILVDVADYRHVHEGPGVMLIGHENDFAMDQGMGRTGLRFNRKRGDMGGLESNLRDGLNRTFALARLLENAPEFKGALRFSVQELLIEINDRLNAPNTAETYAAFQPVIHGLAVDLYGENTFKISRVEDVRSLFGVRVETGEAQSLDALIARLAD